MDISVPSRFACLKIEDEEFRPVSNKSVKKKQEKQAKKIVATTNVNNKKIPPKQPSNSTTTATTSSKKNKTKGKKEEKQWEEWKKKDDEFVNDNFEQDLQSAILQSKLDFENQKKNASVSVVLTSQDSKTKKKKTKTMSLDQFLENGGQNSTKDEVEKEHEEGNFFENVRESAKLELKKEKIEEKRRERTSNIEEIINLAQAQEKLEIERAKNEQLQQELEEARKEIAVVKKRNTTLCSMLSQGEMKDKVAVLMDLERLTTVKEELTEEVARLYKLLEQERSSTKANTANVNGVSESHSAKHKDKHKKKKN